MSAPSEPRRFTATTTHGTQHCVLHPDGRITRVSAGETWTCAFTLAEMLELDWADAELEWDTPEPLAPRPAAEQTQPDLFNTA
jgi:hypothetical protein